MLLNKEQLIDLLEESPKKCFFSMMIMVEKKYGVDTAEKISYLVPKDGGYAIQKGKDDQSKVLYLYNITIKDFATLIGLPE